MEEKIKEIDRQIELKRKGIKLFKEMLLLFEIGDLNKDYFERNIKTLTLEQNGLVDAYNILVKEETK